MTSRGNVATYNAKKDAITHAEQRHDHLADQARVAAAEHAKQTRMVSSCAVMKGIMKGILTAVHLLCGLLQDDDVTCDT